MGQTVTATTNGQPASPQGQTRWDRFLYWSNRFHQWEEFDEKERDYKLTVAGRLKDVRRELGQGEPSWLDTLTFAVTAKPNNLTNWRATQPFLTWCKAEPEHARLAFQSLWNEDNSGPQRMDEFAQIVATSGRTILIAEVSFFHMAMDPYVFPMYRATPVERAMDLTGYPEPKEAGIKSGELGKRYDHFLRFLDIMLKRASDSGIHFRDRLDAQSAAWVVTQWEPVPSWSEPDKQAFLSYQGNGNLRKDSWPSL